MLMGHDCRGAQHRRFYNYTESLPKLTPAAFLTRFFEEKGYVSAAFMEDCLWNARFGPTPVSLPFYPPSLIFPFLPLILLSCC